MTALDGVVKAFREHHGILACIGISGTADDHPVAESAVRAFLLGMRGANIAIVTSGTTHGVPHAAFTEAILQDIAIIRVFPECAKDRGHLIDSPADLEVRIPPRFGVSMWGDESEVFVKLCDAFLFVGGSAGTMIEIAHWAKLNKTRAARKQSLVPAVPLAIGEGWSDWVCREGHSAFAEFYDHATPAQSINSGTHAATWLLERLGL